MKLATSFLRLPLQLDPRPAQAALRELPEAAWRPHPDGYPGNLSINLISPAGDPERDDLGSGAAPTPWLEALPAVRALIEALGVPVGRARLMRLEPGAVVAEHVDARPWWWLRHRVHVPILTNPRAVFYCGYASRVMGEGEAWVFDTWRRHRVVNGGVTPRVHLVCDTRVLPPQEPPALRLEAPGPGPSVAQALSLLFWEEGLTEEPVAALLRALERAPDDPALRREVVERLHRFRGAWRLRNGVDPVAILLDDVLGAEQQQPADPVLQAPVVLLSPPRSGSSMLFEALAQVPGVYTIGGESHTLIEGTPGLGPTDSHALDERSVGAIAALRRRFLCALRDRDGRLPGAGEVVRMVEKTPKNCLRVPFLREAFPDARWVVLARAPREVLSSMLDAWRSGAFVTASPLPGWSGPPWSLLLPPGWRALRGAPLAQVVAAQWRAAVEGIMGLRGPVEVVRYEALVRDPAGTLGPLCARLGLPVGSWPAQLPPARSTLDAPHPEKWRRNAAEVEEALAALGEVPVAWESWLRAREQA